MTKEDIIEKISGFLINEFEIGEDPDFAADVNLFDYGFLDSLGAMMLIKKIEEEFGIEITQKDIVLYPMTTVEEIAEVVEGKL